MSAKPQLSLRALARLLDDPGAELQAAVPELVAVFEAEQRLPLPRRQSLIQWCRRLAAAELLDLQATYVELFDRGRSVSLLLFEHVHGESRDRGQAMVDLLAQYEAAGFALDARELPDYLPLFLEFLSTRDEAAIGDWLGDIRHILALLAGRLEGRNADYALVPLSLLALIGAEGDV
ncbi:MAG: nitrate reductase molybdenum cofactor assembly chaperone [Parahaliea sp.]